MEWSLTKYEEFIYGITNKFSQVRASDLVVKRHGGFWAEVAGKIYFENDYCLEVREIVDFSNDDFIKRYGYAVRKKHKIQYWYDSQEHPNDPSLQSTHPHHKHVEPDIKHNRIPVTELSFNQPNLPFLIEEISKKLLIE